MTALHHPPIGQSLARRSRTAPDGLPRVIARVPWMMVMAAGVTIAALLPLGFVLYFTYETGWATASAMLFRPRVGELLINTVALVALTLPICAGLALALAFLTERSDLPGARLWAWLAVAPLSIPAFVQSYAWVSLIPSLSGLGAGVLISVLAYFPFLYLPIVASLRRLDPALEDAAASLGLAPWRVFVRVIVPQLWLALVGGSLLVGLHLLGEYGLFAMIRFDTFTTAIIDQFQSAFNGPAANMLAIVLALLCLGFIGVETRLRGRERYARVGSGAARRPTKLRLGRFALPALLLPLVTSALALGVPLVTLTQWLIAGGSDIWRLGEIATTLEQTVVLAVSGAVLTTLASVPMAWLSIRSPGRLQRIMEACNYIVGSLPGVVVALALVTITVRVALPLYQTTATILFGYLIMFLPRALISLRASIAQAPIELEEAAASLGKSRVKALLLVTLRLAAPGVAASLALVSLGIMNELTATQMLAPNGTRTLAMAFFAYSSEIDYASAAPYALIMILFSLPLTALLYAQSRGVAGR